MDRGRNSLPRFLLTCEDSLLILGLQVRRPIFSSGDVQTENKFINPKDGKEMILIPAGEFAVGSNDGWDDEKPLHKVYLDAFYISRYPVTNAEYKKFVDATNHAVPFDDTDWFAVLYKWDKKNRTHPKDRADHPVVLVNWNDAVAYCEWAGGHLPTEAEWEKTASWDEAIKEKRSHPWGNGFDSSKCNTEEYGFIGTTPVSKFAPQGDSAYGISDMLGNVWEWCADWYEASYYQHSPTQNPQGPTSGQFRVMRGGSWRVDTFFTRCAQRGHCCPETRGSTLGFRVVSRSPGSSES